MSKGVSMYRKSILAIFIGLFLLGCGGEQQQEQDIRWVTTSEGRRIPQGGMLVAGLISDIHSLNDYTAGSEAAGNIISLMFLKLAELNPDLVSFSPELARSWEFSEDRKQLKFHLRTDVHWWDGTPTTANDVVFTQQIASNPEIASPIIRWKEHISEVEAIDDSTVIFTFDQVYPYQLMDAVTGVILPKHVLDTVNAENFGSTEFNQDPLGNGPFMLQEWKPQEQITLKRNPEYYEEGKPYLDRIVFRIVPDRTTLLTQLRAGEVDFLTNVPPREYQKLTEDYQEGNISIKPYEFPGRSYEFIVWNTIDPDQYSPQEINTLEELDRIPNPYFADSRVRRAMTHALNRNLIRDAVGYGLFMEMTGPIPPILWAHNDTLNPLDYSVEKSRQLLDEAGWIDTDGDGIRDKGGEEFRFTMKLNAGNTRREQTATLAQEMLREVGVQMDIRQIESATYRNDLMTKRFDAAIVGWATSLKVDFTSIFHSKAVFDKFNFSSYRNPEFDRINDRANSTIDRERAKQLWTQAQKILIQDQPYTWLYYQKSTHGLHERFRNVVMDKRGAYNNLEEWWVPVDERKYRTPDL